MFLSNKGNSLARNTVIYAMGDIIPKLLNLITFPILTNCLSTGDYGILNYVNSIVLFLTIITFLCLKTYYLVHYFKVGDETEQKKLLGNLTISVATLNIIITLILMFIGEGLFRLIGSDIDFFPYIFYAVLINFFDIFQQLPSALYRVRERPLPLVSLNILKGFLIMLGTVIFVRQYPSAITALRIQLVVTFVFSLIFGTITVKNAIFRFNYKQLMAALAFSLPLVPGDIAYYFSTMSDRILIEKYLSISDLGIYSTASVIAGMLYIISYGAYKAFEPYFFKTYGKESFNSEFEKIRDVLMFVVIVVGMCLAVYAKEFLTLLSSESYRIAYQYVPVLVLGISIGTLSSLYGTVMTAQSRTKINGAISLSSALLSVITNIILLPIIGIWAAVIAALLVRILSYTVLKLCCHLNVHSSYYVFVILFTIVTGYTMAFCIQSENVLMTILIKSFGLFVFSIVLMRMMKININVIKRLF